MHRTNNNEIRTLIYLMQINIQCKSILLKWEHCNLMQFNNTKTRTLKCNANTLLSYVTTFDPVKEPELWWRVLHLCIVVTLLKEYYISVIFWRKEYYKSICNLSHQSGEQHDSSAKLNEWCISKRWSINSWAEQCFRRARWVARALELHLNGGWQGPNLTEWN